MIQAVQLADFRTLLVVHGEVIDYSLVNVDIAHNHRKTHRKMGKS